MPGAFCLSSPICPNIKCHSERSPEESGRSEESPQLSPINKDCMANLERTVDSSFNLKCMYQYKMSFSFQTAIDFVNWKA